MYDNRIPKNEIWKEVSDKEGPLRCRGIDRKTKYGRMASNCSIRKCGTQKQDIGMTGGRKEGRRTENHRKKKKKKKNLLKNVTVCVHYRTCSFCLHIVAINEKHPSFSSLGTWR